MASIQTHTHTQRHTQTHSHTHTNVLTHTGLLPKKQTDFVQGQDWVDGKV